VPLGIPFFGSKVFQNALLIKTLKSGNVWLPTFPFLFFFESWIARSVDPFRHWKSPFDQGFVAQGLGATWASRTAVLSRVEVQRCGRWWVKIVGHSWDVMGISWCHKHGKFMGYHGNKHGKFMGFWWHIHGYLPF
jgi:hypothetical protein